MIIDERIERHEALAQSIEIMVIEGKRTEENIDKLTANVAHLTSALNGTLQIVASHENRIHKLEPGVRQ